MSFPRYPKYKDSGVDWLGHVPEHWGVGQSRRRFALRNERAREGDKQLTASQEHGVLFQEDFVRLEGRRVVEVIKGADILKHVEPNDFVISMRSFQGGIEWCKLRGSISSAYVMLVPCESINASFFGYLLKSSSYIQALQATSNLVRDGQALRYENFAKVDLPLVSIDEQKQIAAFLDWETAKIDALVAEQRRLMELLKEKRQAVISHAVTKGLNPDAPMKPSGIDWLGDVPAHWALVPFASAIRFQEGPGIMALDFRDTGVPLVRVAGVQGRWATLDGCNYLDPAKVALRWEHFQLQSGDLLISASASMGTVSEVGSAVAGAIPYTGLIRLTAQDERLSRDYVRAMLGSSFFAVQIDLLKAGATIQHFGPSHLSQMKVLLPPTDEQIQITTHLEREDGVLNALVTEAQRAIELLEERRTALIAAAVTGQIDVRGFAESDVA